MELPFESRADAGALLAERLVDLADADMLVLALPRGGVPVGMEIATRFDADLDVLVVQKLGAPDQPELAVGAVGASGRPVVNEGIARAIGVHPQALQARADAVQA